MNRQSLILRRLAVCIVGVALFWFGSTAQATIIADVRGDYAAGTNNGDPGILPATGTGNWNYLASDTVNPTLDGTLDVLPWNSINSSYQNFTLGGSSNSIDLLSVGLSLQEIRMHPSASNRPPPFDVARWIAGVGEAGLINISGNVRKVDAGGGGGVTFDLFVNGISLFNSTLSFNDTVGVAFNQTLTVGVGSTVDFVVGPNGLDAFDSTGLKATITAVPEPTTMTLLGIGLVGLIGASARRRIGKRLKA